MKLINEEQYSEMMTDLSELISKIDDAKNTFNKEVLIKEIVNQFKLSLRKNSLFKSLDNENLELQENLIALKNVKKEFIECKNLTILKLISISLMSFVIGSVTTAIVIKILNFNI